MFDYQILVVEEQEEQQEGQEEGEGEEEGCEGTEGRRTLRLDTLAMEVTPDYAAELLSGGGGSGREDDGDDSDVGWRDR